MADNQQSVDVSVPAFPDAGPLAASFADGDPFPHVVIDGFFDTDLVRQVVAEFPDARAMERHYNDTAQAKKSTNATPDLWGPTTRAVMDALNSPEALRWLSEVTGIDDLVPDLAYEGGGLHQIQRGGKLGIHADFNRHLRTGEHRRLNLLVYLNEDWQDEWGGHLELWDQEMSRCVQRVAPIAGRAVLFATTSTSFHGHPDPLDCPDHITRKSLALYYYTAAPDDIERHSTLFQVRPGSTDQIPPVPWKTRLLRLVRRLQR